MNKDKLKPYLKIALYIAIVGLFLFLTRDKISKQEDGRIYPCLWEASEKYANFWRNEYKNNPSEGSIKEIQTLYDNEKEECYKKYHKGYQEYLKYNRSPSSINQ